MIRYSLFLRFGMALGFPWLAAAFAQSTKADSLNITYAVNQNQTAVVGPGFTVVDFTGSVTNNSDAAITFQLTGVLHNFELMWRRLWTESPFLGSHWDRAQVPE